MGRYVVEYTLIYYCYECPYIFNDYEEKLKAFCKHPCIHPDENETGKFLYDLNQDYYDLDTYPGIPSWCPWEKDHEDSGDKNEN